jgi:hypothetical protein
MSRLVNVVLAVGVAVVVYLLGEGLFAISQGDQLHRSLTHRLADLVGLIGGPAPRYLRPVLTDPDEVEALLDEMREHGVGLGNSPYAELQTEAASISREVDGCPQGRPDISKTVTSLRTPLFEAFNPITIFYDSDRVLPERLQQFVDDYAFRPTVYSTDEFGQRRTFPEVDAHDMVFVAGDSVAVGALVDDDETLASALQRRDPDRRYVNLGHGGAEAAEIRCNLERAAARHPDRARELVYVYCENDFDEDESMGTPESVIAWLRQFVAEQGFERTTVVYAPYIFNVVPEFTRIGGTRRERFADHADEKGRLTALVEAAGFDWIDFGEIALSEVDAHGSSFGALALYVDVVHHSPLGIERLADALHARHEP